MAIKIRLKRLGKKKQPVYRVVVAKSAEARDGQTIEVLGTYDPTQSTMLQVKQERVSHWLSVGAQPTDTVQRLLSGIGMLPKVERQSALLGVAKKDRKKDA